MYTLGDSARQIRHCIERRIDNIASPTSAGELDMFCANILQPARHKCKSRLSSEDADNFLQMRQCRSRPFSECQSSAAFQRQQRCVVPTAVGAGFGCSVIALKFSVVAVWKRLLINWAFCGFVPRTNSNLHERNYIPALFYRFLTELTLPESTFGEVQCIILFCRKSTRLYQVAKGRDANH